MKKVYCPVSKIVLGCAQNMSIGLLLCLQYKIMYFPQSGRGHVPAAGAAAARGGGGGRELPGDTQLAKVLHPPVVVQIKISPPDVLKNH